MPERKKDPLVKEVEMHFVRRLELAEKVCPVCGEKFIGTKKARYDKLACRQKANYGRNKKAYLAQKREKYQAEKEGTVPKPRTLRASSGQRTKQRSAP